MPSQAEIPPARATTHQDLTSQPSSRLFFCLQRRGQRARHSSTGAARGKRRSAVPVLPRRGAKKTHSWGVEELGGSGVAAELAPAALEAAVPGGKLGERPSGKWDTSAGAGTTTASSCRGDGTPFKVPVMAKISPKTPTAATTTTERGLVFGHHLSGNAKKKPERPKSRGRGAQFLTHLVWKMWLHGKRLAPVTISSRQMMQTLSMACSSSGVASG